jgi:plastocyanin domain-containing protein
MSGAQIAVTIAGVLGIAWVLWFFLVARGRGVAARADRGVQEIRVLVKGGYAPDTIIVQAGSPVRLQFYRDETADCSEQLVLDAFGIRETLPPFTTTTVEFTPHEPGEFPFRCGRNVMQGLVVVEPAGERRGSSSPHKFHG